MLNHVPLFAKGFEAFRLGIRPRGAIASDIGVLWVGLKRIVNLDNILQNLGSNGTARLIYYEEKQDI